MELQRQLALVHSRQVSKNSAAIRYATTVVQEHFRITVTLTQFINSTPLDLQIVKQLTSEYLKNTDQTDSLKAADDIYDRIAAVFPERDIEVLIYDTVDCLAVMKIYKFNQPAI